MYYLFIVSLCFYMLTLLHMVAHLLDAAVGKAYSSEIIIKGGASISFR